MLLRHIGSLKDRDTANLKRAIKDLDEIRKVEYDEISGLTHKHAILKMIEADILICIVTPQRKFTTPPGKLYEYAFGARKPVLYIIPEDGKMDDGAELVKENCLGWVVRNDYDELYSLLFKILPMTIRQYAKERGIT